VSERRFDSGLPPRGRRNRQSRCLRPVTHLEDPQILLFARQGRRVAEGHRDEGEDESDEDRKLHGDRSIDGTQQEERCTGATAFAVFCGPTRKKETVVIFSKKWECNRKWAGLLGLRAGTCPYSIPPIPPMTTRRRQYVVLCQGRNARLSWPNRELRKRQQDAS